MPIETISNIFSILDNIIDNGDKHITLDNSMLVNG